MKGCSLMKMVFVIFFVFNFLITMNSVGYAGDLIKGKVVYDDTCIVCHGAEGTPFLPGVPDFSKGESLDKDKAELVKSIINGHPPKHGAPPMTAMKFKLTNAEVENALTYIQTLKK